MKKKIKDNEQFRAKLDEILEQVLMEDTPINVAVKQQNKISPPDINDSLDFLRLNVIYLLFDLEATRRENKYLRNLLREEK